MTTDIEIYLQLQRQARKSGRDTLELMTLYVLEGFLSRLAKSQFNEKLILKGGVLLAAWNARRSTRDIDFAGLNVGNEVANVLDICREISSISEPDSVFFESALASAVTIRDEDEYSGVRVSMQATLASAKITFHIDVNVGDPVVPSAVQVAYPRILEGREPIALLGYPISMVLAEKIVTAAQRGSSNTRRRDFGDIYNIIRIHSMNASDLRDSVWAVSSHRKAEILELEEVLRDYPAIGQAKYEIWRDRQDRLELPRDFELLLEAIFNFTDPVLGDRVPPSSIWDPHEQTWS